MSYRRLSLIILGQLIILFPIIFFAAKLIEGNVNYLVALIFFSIYFLCSFGFVIKEIQKVHKDKLDGIQSSILYFCKQNTVYKSSGDNMPPIQLATFRYSDRDEYISLSGDYSNSALVEGKMYKVRFYKNTGILVDIAGFGNKRKIIKKVISKKSFTKGELYNRPTFLEVLISFLIYGGPTFIVFWLLYMIFKFLQEAVILNERDFLIIQPDLLILVFIFWGFITFLLLLYEKEEPVYLGKLSELYKKLGFPRTMTILSAAFLLVLTILFNTYTKISEDKIEYHNIYSSKTYFLSDIDQVKVYPYYYNKKNKLKVSYNIVMKDGNRLEVNSSDMFWKRIDKLDRHLSGKGIPINKAHISYADYIRILLDENLDSEGAGVLQEILVADGSYTY